MIVDNNDNFSPANGSARSILIGYYALFYQGLIKSKKINISTLTITDCGPCYPHAVKFPD